LEALIEGEAMEGHLNLKCTGLGTGRFSSFQVAGSHQRRTFTENISKDSGRDGDSNIIKGEGLSFKKMRKSMLLGQRV